MKTGNRRMMLLAHLIWVCDVNLLAPVVICCSSISAVLMKLEFQHTTAIQVDPLARLPYPFDQTQVLSLC